MDGFIMFFAPLFIIGGIWSIMFVGFMFALMIALTESDSDFFALAVLGMFGFCFLHFNPTLTMPSLGTALTYAAYYFIFGTGWSVGKWYFVLREKVGDFGETKMAFFRAVNKQIADKTIPEEHKHGVEPVEVSAKTAIPEKLQEAFKKYIEENSSFYVYTSRLRDDSFGAYLEQFVPTASNNKSRLVRWIAWWPMSFVWTIINDPIRKLANEIFSRMHGIYNTMAKAMFKGILN